MTQRPDSDAFISSGVQRIVRSPFIKSFEQKPEVFDVFALHHKPTEKSFSSDVFVFDSKTSQLLGVILGIQYQRVSKIAMSKLLTRLTPGARQPHLTVETSNIPKTESNMSTVEPGQLRTAESVVIQSKPQSGPGVASKVVAVISEMVGVDADKVTDDTNLADLGIDSLMGMELSRELESIFKCTLDMASMLQLTDVKDLFKWIRTAIGEADIKPEPPKDDLLEQSIEMERASSLTTSSPINSAGESDILSETPPSGTMSPVLKSATSARQAAIDLYVAKYSSEFSMTSLGLKSIARSSSPSLTQHVVLVTGATGSLGAHLVEHFARLSSVGTVVCFNRPSSRMEPMARMRQALIEKGICLDDNAFAKLQVIASDTSKPLLGLDQKAYQSLVSTVTHVVHCAWPMSITRSIFEFEKQFIAMRNLIDLGRDVAHTLPSGVKVGFQFISSIATVGMYPVITQNSIVTEDVSNAKYALPSGYSDAKLVCERLVNETLNRYPERFNGMSVRVGQISGSKTSGYWNPVEHFSLMIKSAHNLKTFPNLQGHLSWLPANDVAATLADLALCVSPSSNIYHVENPVRQSWPEAVSILADELGIPSSSIIPFNEWLDRVRFFSSVHDTNNPAKKVITFLEKDFQRMACGGLVLGTDKAVQDSSTLRQAKPIEDVLIRKYIRIWKDKGIL
jgi:thioester reductase-like protein/acyl carrier protein